ncbi:uncharacterized protein MELLADRAFT_79384 [Melampsora larici-populina 98AG31]|uniref:Wbp11/ELF5/Saf1 N-terminal domain-containing protein n=1 Tax=Melampsora larici-populina (strain 98AG31 / pathotype 3-4-7) TaxID=747676 RepID=F4S671_MELLP|nr:uncharacterized protein MELLADRAFT_79384 [Melampsora larici-populina 98AG31]EGF99883.1 hypothetical protein MELLADRAFT_79384 [Melampsora larici-populina 98AG31]
MAKKSKSLNPADAFRKAQRAKEIKRNKLERKKAREEAHTKRDTKSIEAEIRQLENLEKLTTSEQTRLKDLKAELIQFRKAKDSTHGTGANGLNASSHVIIDPATGLPSTLAGTAPEGSHSIKTGSAGPSRQDSRTMDWFGPDGKLLEPEKSFYYDPVFNPFGVPPPGMPMRMKPSVETNTLPSIPDPSSTPSNKLPGKNHKATEGEEDEEEKSDEDTSNDESTDDEDDDDDEIPLPEGPPPDPVISEDDEDDDDDDIPLPEGPPPAVVPVVPRAEPFISRPAFNRPPPQQPHLHPSMLPPPPFYPPPISLVPGSAPPPMSFGVLPFPMGPNGLPLPPPSFGNFHPLPVAPASAQLPPKLTTQVNPMTRATSVQSAGPDKATVQASATLTALPQLRDLKREATSFVPSAIRKKKKELDRRADLAGLGDSNRIQAAPDTGDDTSLASHGKEGSLPSSASKPLVTSLLGALKRDGLVVDGQAKNGTNSGGATDKDDYDKFVQSLGDVL